MLWIQYQTNEKGDTSFILEFVETMALLIAPFPVGVYNIGTNGLGLVFHNGVMDVGNRDDGGDESVDDDGDSHSDGEELREHMENDVGSAGSESLIDANDGETLSGDVPFMNVFPTTAHDSQIHSRIHVGGLSATASTTAHQPEPRDGNSSGGSQDRSDTSGDGGGSNLQSSHTPTGNTDNTGVGKGSSEGDDEFTGTASTVPKNEEGNSEYEMFTGLAQVRLPGPIEQQLYISFGLQISSSENTKRSAVDCKISLDRAVFGASSMEDLENDDVELDHYFVVEKVQISAGPSDGECSAPHSVVPRERSFILKYTETDNWQATLGLMASPTPTGTLGAIYGESKEKQRPTVVVEVEGFRCGGGPRQSYRWRYRPKSESAKTHVEFSVKNPPTHTVTFTVPSNAKNPKSFKVTAKAVYQRKGLFQRLSNAVSARLRLKQDVQLRHFSMELEANIGNETDYCRFPAPQEKNGAYLRMQVNALTGVIEPGMERAGLVSSTFKPGFSKSRKLN
jgi:hypothetical protein